MTRWHWRWMFWSWWCAAAAAAAAAELVAFALNPPINQDVPVRSTATITVLGETPKAPPRYTERNEMLGTVLVSGKGNKRWLTHRITESTLTVNGEPRADKAAAALVGQSVGYAFDAQGTLTAVRGLEALAIQLKQTLGPGAPGKEALAPFYQRSWDRGFGRFWGHLAGRKAEPGTSWTDAGTINMQQLGLPVLPAAGTWTVVGLDPSAGGRARVRFEYTAEPTPLGGADAAFRQWLSAKIPALSAQVWVSARATEGCEILIDPATLLAGEQTCRGSLWVESAGTPPVLLQIDTTGTTRIGP